MKETPWLKPTGANSYPTNVLAELSVLNPIPDILFLDSISIKAIKPAR